MNVDKGWFVSHLVICSIKANALHLSRNQIEVQVFKFVGHLEISLKKDSIAFQFNRMKIEDKNCQPS